MPGRQESSIVPVLPLANSPALKLRGKVRLEGDCWAQFLAPVVSHQ